MKEGPKNRHNNYIDLEKNTARVQMMSFHLAEYYFRSQRFPEAAALYEQANIDNLSNREICRYEISPGLFLFHPAAVCTGKAFI